MHVTPTIGRHAEIERVAAGLTAGCVVLRGAQGVGKTRVAREALERHAVSTGATWITATAAARSLPLGAFVGAVTAALRNGGADAIAEVLQALASNSSVVVIDDAHLLDASSATLVHALAHDDRVRLLVVLDAYADAPDAIGRLAGDDRFVCVDLLPLSPLEVNELAASVLGRYVERLAGQRLWDLSQGSPFVVRELLAAAEGERDGSTVWQFPVPVRLSPALRNFVDSQLVGCDRSELEALRLLAFAESIRASALASEHEAPLVDRLAERRLVATTEDDDGCYVSVAHPLVAAVLCDDCPPMAAFEIKERLLMLTAGADRPGDRVRRVDWQLETGRDVAVEDLRAAVQTVVVRDRDRARVRRFGRELLVRERTKAAAIVILNGLLRQGRAEEALDLVEVAKELPGTEEEQGELAFVTIDALAWILGDLEEARQALEIWRQELGDHACFAEAHFAMALASRGSLEDAAAIATPLLEHPNQFVRWRAVTPATSAMLMAGDTTGVLALTASLIEGVDTTSRLSDAPLYVGAPRVLAMLLAGELADAEALLTLGMLFWSEGGDTTDHGMTEVGMGRLRLLQGRPADAAAVLRDAVSHFSGFADYGRRSWSCALLAEALALTGDLDGARWALRSAEECRDIRYPLYDLDGRRAAAWIVAAEGDVGEAQHTLEAVAATACAYRMFPFELMTRYDAFRLGSQGQVQELARLATTIDGRWPSLFLRHARDHADPDALDVLATDFEAIGANLFAAETAAQAGEQFRRCGRAADAARAFARAAALRTRCDGALTPTLLTSGRAHPLTAREAEIALLASRGASTKAIAEKLELSGRTVDNTLGRVYAKLGVGSRAELAQLFAAIT